MSWRVYFDDVQEGIWFTGLHPELQQAALAPITGAVGANGKLEAVLRYDRPDIVLAADDEPVLVLERTVEVPSGHNVGQRFARLAAAAEARVPLVYFGPYVARKHGGITAGPRWMNLRLFDALAALSRINDTATTTIRWPVDAHYEILQQPAKDEQVRRYLETFFAAYASCGAAGLSAEIMRSSVQRELLAEQRAFAAGVKSAGRYERPPPSVTIASGERAAERFGIAELATHAEIVLYTVGMRKIRSDPYTGMAMLYRYLYVLAEPERDRRLILHFPHVEEAAWDRVAAAVRRKDVRLYREVADGIVFTSSYRSRSLLLTPEGTLA